MDPENRARAELILPNPQGPSRVSEIELAEVSLHDTTLLRKGAQIQPRPTWLTFLRKELEFLGVTQILIGLTCLWFGTFVFSMLTKSDFEENIFSSFEAGYPFWGAIFFFISGFLSIMSEEKREIYLLQGSLGANTVSSMAAGTGIIILLINLKTSMACIYNCQDTYEEDFCLIVSFSTEIVAVTLFITVLGFCSAVSLTIYGVGEIFERSKIPEDRLYEELNIYSPIYSELEERGEISSPSDS
ncbi:high affinity immunoglobulin epsilon receptor subunit beta [Equus quagga]|uniref:high affinity immunoglobulin epsilon receptor subunit beta n=1 Tax=Equus quagga TaxID=89248 RepID=UPI001EE30A3F|nr:high affinity immunoglobulin epsilon receptor subunit beta [Equus quagga]